MSDGARSLDLASIQERLADLQDPDRSPGGSAYTELYFRPEPLVADPPPALVFHHIRKTAGTSFRTVLRRNLKRHPSVSVPSLRHGPEQIERTRPNLLAWHRELHERLSAEEWSQLACVTSHEASYFVPLLKGPALGFTLVRDPVDRVVSRYWFANRPGKDGGERPHAEGPGIGAELRGRSLAEIYDEIGGAEPASLDRGYAFGALFNGQARSLLEPHFDTAELTFSAGPPADADLWRERLAEIVERHYLLGISDRFDEGLVAIAARFGWKRTEAAREKVNAARPSADGLPAAVGDQVAAYNWLDTELYARARADSDRRLAERPALPTQRSKTYQRVVKGRIKGERSAVDAYFAPEPLSAEVPTVVFQHLPKTAGTSLRDVLHRNYAPGAERVVVSAARDEDRADAAKRWYAGLSERERASLACIAGHPANHLLYLIERPRRAITIVREPVDRVLSRFHFGGQKRGNAGIPHTLEMLFADPERLAGEEPSLSRQYVNGQSRALLAPLHDVDVASLAWAAGPPDDAEVWRERLFEAVEADYLVGVQERFEQAVIGFGAEFGWAALASPRAKVNRARPPRAAEDEALLAGVRAYNWLDAELYRRYADRSPSDRSGAARTVKPRGTWDGEERDRTNFLQTRGFLQHLLSWR